MTLLNRVTRLESTRPKRCVLGFVVLSTDRRVLGVASIGQPDAALELWARSAEPKNTRAILFSCDPSEEPPTVPVDQMHPSALEVAERVARAAPKPYPLQPT